MGSHGQFFSSVIVRKRERREEDDQRLTNFLLCTKMVFSSVSTLNLTTSPSRLRYKSSLPSRREREIATFRHSLMYHVISSLKLYRHTKKWLQRPRTQTYIVMYRSDVSNSLKKKKDKLVTGKKDERVCAILKFILWVRHSLPFNSQNARQR